MLPLLLGLMGLGGMGMMGVQGLSDIKDKHDALQRKGFADDFNAMQQGIDPNSPEGLQQLQLRMMADNRMQQTGSGMLDNSLQRRQQNDQFQQGFNNLSVAQQAQMQQSALAQQQQNQYQQGMLGMRGRELDQDMMLKQQQMQRANMFTPEDLLKQESALRGEYQAQMKPYQQFRTAYNQAIKGLEGSGSGFDTLANVINFAKVLDPTSVVRTEEGDQVRDSTGLIGSMTAQLQQYKGKTVPAEMRQQMADTLYGLAQSRMGDAQTIISDYRNLAGAEPHTGIPGVNANRVLAGIDISELQKPDILAIERARQMQQQNAAITGQPGGGAAPSVVTLPGIDRSKLIEIDPETGKPFTNRGKIQR